MRQEYQLDLAGVMGAEHAERGMCPFGDLDLDDSPLMDALGETEPTTDANHAFRLALVNAYRDALGNTPR